MIPFGIINVNRLILCMFGVLLIILQYFKWTFTRYKWQITETIPARHQAPVLKRKTY